MYYVFKEDMHCPYLSWEDTGMVFDSYDEAEKYCFAVHDGGFCGDLLIRDTDDRGWRFRDYQLAKGTCPECGREVRHMDLRMTHDCNGIPYRHLCPDCYDRIMNERWYDGEYYTEADECIEDY